jgi:adenylate kinase family enzyme
VADCPQEMRRVVVAGITGAGKTTLARELSRVTGLPFVELDGFVEGPGWSVLPDFRRSTEQLVAGPSWITDNLWYPEVQDLLLARADTVVWLDVDRPEVVKRLLRRSLRRGLPPRPVLVNGNRERLWAIVRASSPLRTAWSHHASHRTHLEQILSGHRVVRLRTPAQVEDWLLSVAPDRP